MDVQSCYEVIKGDYEEISRRLMKEERIKKFLLMFLQDESFDKLCTAMEQQDYPVAFRESHTLKGLCKNMAFTDLLESVDPLTECLRGGECKEGTMEFFEEVKVKYTNVRKGIEELRDGE